MKKTLLQLLHDNRRAGGQRLTRIEAAANKEGPTVVFLYDMIVNDRWLAEWYGAVCAQDLVPELEAIDGDILLRINCPGGDVFAMKAIMSCIRGLSGKVTAQIDGVCASAATAIACACSEVAIGRDANYMIHNAQGIAVGDRNELRKMANLQEKIDGQLADTYVAKTGKERDEIVAWMDDETWFTAEQAVEHGFADRILDETDKNVKALGGWKLTAYAKAPRVEASAEPTNTPEPQQDPGPELVSEERDERIRQRVRLAALLDNKFTSASRAA